MGSVAPGLIRPPLPLIRFSLWCNLPALFLPPPEKGNVVSQKILFVARRRAHITRHGQPRGRKEILHAVKFYLWREGGQITHGTTSPEEGRKFRKRKKFTCGERAGRLHTARPGPKKEGIFAHDFILLVARRRAERAVAFSRAVLEWFLSQGAAAVPPRHV